MDVGGSRILITGASGGLGRRIASTLAARGARVVLSGRDLRALQEVQDVTGGEIVVADLCDAEAVADLAAQAGEFDALVLNAGHPGESPLGELEPGWVDAVIDTNLRAPVHLSVAFARRHIEAGTPGSLVLIGSVAGVTASAGLELYNATKFGLRGFALSLAQDLHGTSVQVTHIAPGFIRDAGMFADSGVELPRVVRTKAPEDVAVAVVRAIENGPTEIWVAPSELRAAALCASGMPALGASVIRRLGISPGRPVPDAG
jgi:short-subunit dehydrogenase